MKVDQFVDEMLPILFEVMNTTGQGGHCILVSKVLDLIFGSVGMRSEPLCVDYEVANPAAVKHLKAGGSSDTLRGAAFVGRTGTGEFGMYDHHVVTLIPFDTTATLIDPSIIQVTRTVPDVDIPMIVLDLSYPLPRVKSIEVSGSRITYTFLPDLRDFAENSQWTDDEPANGQARAILRHMGLTNAADAIG